MAVKQGITSEEILRDLANKNYKPIYLLMGEEAYYIDLIDDYIEQNVLTETEKDFNQIVMYGMDVDAATITNTSLRFPMMAERQVVVVKEAQNVADLQDLVYYAQNPMKSTILVLCYKHGVMDRRKKLFAQIEKNGVVFESKKIRDAQLPAFITTYLKKKRIDIEQKASMMLTDYVGVDLLRLVGELDKLIITLPKGQMRITADQVEKNIGISKEYNMFEFRDALVKKDVLKANRIINYYASTPKDNPLPKTLAGMFSFFSNLMMAYYAPDKSERGIATWLGFRQDWQARDYITAMRCYTGVKTMHIISEIRRADALSKGIGKGNLSDDDILRELLYFVLH